MGSACTNARIALGEDLKKIKYSFRRNDDFNILTLEIRDKSTTAEF